MKIVFSFLSVAFFILFSAEKLSAQNLVPNPSFEEYTDCPHYDGFLFYSAGWNGFSADYFNSCDTTLAGVPLNGFGFQYASEGQAYSGIFTYALNTQNYREFISTQLMSSLTPGIKYYVSLKVSLSDVSVECATNNLGVLFSTSALNESAYAPIKNYAAIHSYQIITDTLNWIVISGVYIPDSSYSYFNIGNFFSDSLTQLSNSSNCLSAYYFIDDVCVSPDSFECDLNPEGIYNLPPQQIAIYPNPATEQLIINNGQLIIKGIELFDLVGRKMMDDELLVNNSNHYTINTKNFPRGYYFIRIHTSEGMINRKIVLQ